MCTQLGRIVPTSALPCPPYLHGRHPRIYVKITIVTKSMPPILRASSVRPFQSRCPTKNARHGSPEERTRTKGPAHWSLRPALTARMLYSLSPIGFVRRENRDVSSQGVCTPGGENCSSERQVGRIILPQHPQVKSEVDICEADVVRFSEQFSEIPCRSSGTRENSTDSQ